MNVDKLAEVVEDMIVQHDYPGFEPRALKLGLPESVNKGPAKVYSQALGHSSVYVKLAALRWFQEKPGMVKNYINAVVGLLDNPDPYVRVESMRLLERASASKEIAIKIAALLSDEDLEVQKAAARACGKICKKLKIKDASVIDCLQQAASQGSNELRGKAEKALRKIGVYD